MFDFAREDVFPSWFANRIQDFLSSARTDLRLSLKSTTSVQVVPDSELGIAGIALEGAWRFNTGTISRDHPGGAAGTYTVWAVGTVTDVDDSPKPHTDHTNYAFDLRITSGANPSGSGVEIFEKIGEVDWNGTEIEALRQTHGSVTGAMLADGSLSSEAPSDITWVRAPGGGLVPTLKANSVGATELADASVDTAALVDLAVVAAKVAAEAITEGKLAPNSVATAKIINLAVTTAKLAAGAVTNEKLGASAVGVENINNLAVTTAKLAAEAVTGEKVGNLAIAEAKLAAEAVGNGKIKNLAVTASKIAEEAVETAKIKNLNVTAAKLAANAVETAKILDAAVTDAKLGSPNNGIWRTLASAKMVMSLDLAEGFYHVAGVGTGVVLNGHNVTGLIGGIELTAFKPTEYVVAGKTLEMRCNACLSVNSTKPEGRTIKIGWWKLSGTAGGPDEVQPTMEFSGIEGPKFESPAVGENQKYGEEAAPPANNNIYGFGLQLSGGALTNNCAIQVNAEVQFRHI